FPDRSTTQARRRCPALRSGTGRSGPTARPRPSARESSRRSRAAARAPGPEPRTRCAPQTRRRRTASARTHAPRLRSATEAPTRRAESTAVPSLRRRRRQRRRHARPARRCPTSTVRPHARRPAGGRAQPRRGAGRNACAARRAAESPLRLSRAPAVRRRRRRRGSPHRGRRPPRRAPLRRRGAASRRQLARLAASEELYSRRVSGLRIERDGHLLRVTLAKPDRRNAFDAALIRELTEAFAGVGDARAVVLAGEGESFCAGADIEWQRSAIDLSYEENVEDALRLFRMCETIDTCGAPVVARVQGYALGGGSGLVACADVAIAAPDATFGFSEVKLGIVPAVISPFVLPKIGAHARRYFLTGERFDADTALRIGLVHELADDLNGAVDRVVGE